MSKTIFKEKQRFDSPLAYVALGLAFVVITYTTFFSGGDKTIESQLLSYLPFLLVLAFFFTIKLKTRIDENGIHVSFFPFIIKEKTFSWSDIYSAEAEKYSPISEYGGWGYRIKFSKKAKAFTTRGNKGIKVVLKDGKIRMIGTQKMEDANLYINQHLEKKA